MPKLGPNEIQMKIGTQGLKNFQPLWEKYRKNPQQCFIVIDEMSLCGQQGLFWIDSRCRQATGKNLPFGGFSIILCGDFGQLPPVEDQPIFDTTKQTRVNIAARGLYKMFDNVVILKQNMRCKNKRWKDFLLRVRDCCTTREDYEWISENFRTDDEGRQYAQ